MSCWCAECYTSENEVLNFYVKGTKQFHTEGLDREDNDRLELAWGALQQQKTEYTHAREGDHLLVPFECDFCIFQKLRNMEEPNYSIRKDAVLMACIRRINLDCFWSRATSTVLANRDKARRTIELSELVGLQGAFEHTMALPLFDHCGYEVAIQMVLDSTSPGRYSKDHKQWDTIRKIRTVYSSQAKASPQENANILAFSDDRGKPQRLVRDKCASYWFARFFEGCKRRMGQDWRPNKALLTDLVLEVLNNIKARYQEPNISVDKRHNWVTFGTYVAVSYVLSLRGVEGLLLDVEGLLENLRNGDDSYFIIALRGKIKMTTEHRCHLMPCCTITSSGINVKEWVITLLEHTTELGFRKGPAIADITGKARTCAQLDEMFTDVLEEIYEERPNLFPPSIKSKEDIASRYSVFRSLRRSSDTRALVLKVAQTDITLVNRWSSDEAAKGNRASHAMLQHYAEVELLIAPFTRYTKAM